MLNILDPELLKTQIITIGKTLMHLKFNICFEVQKFEIYFFVNIYKCLYC